jgi:hypothetical protein
VNTPVRSDDGAGSRGARAAATRDGPADGIPDAGRPSRVTGQRQLAAIPPFPASLSITSIILPPRPTPPALTP